MTPGPVPLPQEVLNNMALPMEHHRTPEFIALWNRALGHLKRVFQTEQNVFIHTSTGSGGMESALVNVLSPGDRVIAVVSGKFGERWADMAETFGANVTRIEVPWGKAVKVSAIEDALRDAPETIAVLCQACETSTGVLHPIREIARTVSQSKALFLVDGITALGALPLPMDDWGIDVLVGGSQKAFMLPAGLSFISFSKKAWTRVEKAKCPRYYFDIRKEKAANDNGESYFSSAVTHVRALDLVLNIFLSQGLERVYARIQTLSKATLLAATEMGIGVFPEAPSPSLSALVIPEGIDGQKVRTDMERIDTVIVMGGQDQLKGKIIRIGHMGAIHDEDLLRTLRSFASSLNRLKPGTVPEDRIFAALKKATEVLRESPLVAMKAPLA